MNKRPAACFLTGSLNDAKEVYKAGFEPVILESTVKIEEFSDSLQEMRAVWPVTTTFIALFENTKDGKNKTRAASEIIPGAGFRLVQSDFPWTTDSLSGFVQKLGRQHLKTNLAAEIDRAKNK